MQDSSEIQKEPEEGLAQELQVGKEALSEPTEANVTPKATRGQRMRGLFQRLTGRGRKTALLPSDGNAPKVKFVHTATKVLRQAISKVKLRRRRSVALTEHPSGVEAECGAGAAPRKRSRLAKQAGQVWNKAVQGVGFSVAFGAAAAGSLLLFRMLNRTKVHGLENIPVEHENVLYCLNHCSLLDNFAFEAAAYVPKVFFKRKYLPISLADRKNFFGDPSSRRLKDRVLTLLGRHFFRHLKAYPVDRRTGDMGQVEQWKALLKNNIVIVFPEGTRTRTGEIGAGKPGVGKLIYEARPIVMPVQMTGTDKILGVGMKFPAVFRKIEVFIGEPMKMEDLLNRELPDNRKEQMLLYAEISDTVMDRIRYLNPATRDQVGKAGVHRLRSKVGQEAPEAKTKGQE